LHIVRVLVLILFSLLAAGPASGAAPAPGADVLQAGVFRIFYQRGGKDAVPPADADNNGIPDFVEDVGKQLEAARHIFHDVAGFRDPLASPRYSGVRYVDVFILGPEKMSGKNGLAGNKIQPARPPAKIGEKALLLRIAGRITPSRNPTPAHEYFHLIQYGMTRFANSWYLEGMARWSEDVVRAKYTDGKPLPKPEGIFENPGAGEELYGLSYKAEAVLWAPLARFCRQGDAVVPAEDSALALRYADGKAVVADRLLHGAGFMKAVLEEIELAQARMLQSPQGDVGEGAIGRNDPANNPHILEAVRAGFSRACR
jgi:hypothetical protein